MESGQGTGLENQTRRLEKAKTNSKKRSKEGQWEVCEDFANDEAFLRRFPFGLDEEGRGVELAFEAVKRVNVGEKYIAEPL